MLGGGALAAYGTEFIKKSYLRYCQGVGLNFLEIFASLPDLAAADATAIAVYCRFSGRVIVAVSKRIRAITTTGNVLDFEEHGFDNIHHRSHVDTRRIVTKKVSAHASQVFVSSHPSGAC